MVLSQVINSAFSLDPVKQSKVFLIFYYGDKSCQIAVKKIHQTRGKFPKPMNHPADQGLKDNYSGEKKRRGIFQRLMARPFLVLGWIAVGIACLLLAIFVLYPHRNAPASMLSDLKTRPEVFRIKIPEEIKIEQNLFRRKIPDIDQVVKLPTKIDSMPPVEKKAVLTQPIVALAKQREPNQETKIIQPIESPIKSETTPPVVQAVPSPPTDASPEKSEPRQDTEPHPPAEPEAQIVTILPAEEQPVSSQLIVAPSEQIKLPEKGDLRQAEVRPQPVKEDVIEKTQERIIHGEKWLLSQGSSYYTIQLMGVRKEALLFDFVERNQLLEQNEIAYYQTIFKDKPWFQLLYGIYATKKDAQAAADNLPLKIRKSSPWIRRLSAVQKAIRRKAAQ
ncbi:MAG: SPOR domain-containing protein [Desulfobacterales bacterium]